MKKLLVSSLLLASTVLGGTPSLAWSSLQWRTTTCQVWSESAQEYFKGKCQAAFGYDTALRAIKFWTGERWMYKEVGQPGVRFSRRFSECLAVDYDDGDYEHWCTDLTPSQLGIIGD